MQESVVQVCLLPGLDSSGNKQEEDYREAETSMSPKKTNMPSHTSADLAFDSHPQVQRGGNVPTDDMLAGHHSVSECEVARLEKDRKDWRELATFLRTNEPPRTNFMSDFPEGKNKKGSLKIFRRPAKKSLAGSPKSMQLPDSAVAAKTKDGHWYIAISIPLSAISTFADDVHSAAEERHRITEEHHSAPPPICRPISAGSRQQEQQRRIERQESAEDIHPAFRINPTRPLTASASADALGGETANTLRSYYRRERFITEADEAESRQVAAGPRSLDSILASSNTASNTSSRPVLQLNIDRSGGKSLKRETFGPVTPPDILPSRQSSQRTGTDQRHSGGTAYSERTLETVNHSRGPSASSAAGAGMPSIPEPPPRSSSRQPLNRPPKGNLEGKGRDGAGSRPGSPIKMVTREGSGASLGSRHAVSNSWGSDKESSAIMVDSLSRSPSSVRNAPRTAPPTRALPDLPELSDDASAPAGRGHGHSRSMGASIRHTLALPHIGSRRVVSESQERKEKVKALRMRDISAHAAKTKKRRSTHPSSSAPHAVGMFCSPACSHAHAHSASTQSRPAGPVRHASNSSTKRQSGLPSKVSSPDFVAAVAGKGISLSPIMTVASTTPTSLLPGAYPVTYSCATPTSTTHSLPDDFLDSLLPAYNYSHSRDSSRKHDSGSGHSGLSGVDVQRFGDGRRGSVATLHSTMTPPRSLTPSFASSDEEGPLSPRTPPSRHTSHRNSRGSTRGRHLYRRIPDGSATDMGEKEDVKEIKERVKRLERDNERILKTLGSLMGISAGVRELCDLLATDRVFGNGGEVGTREVLGLGRRESLKLAADGMVGEEAEVEIKPLDLGKIESRRNSQTSSDQGIDAKGEDDDFVTANYTSDEEGAFPFEEKRHHGDGLAPLEREEMQEREMEGYEQLSSVEPLMSELRLSARISQESRVSGSDEDSFGIGQGS